MKYSIVKQHNPLQKDYEPMYYANPVWDWQVLTRDACKRDFSRDKPLAGGCQGMLIQPASINAKSPEGRTSTSVEEKVNFAFHFFCALQKLSVVTTIF